ncbi:MAG: tripartite tricarboxylate transporter substrate binding protein [Polaromonas sp.]|nr:tripartite tricarboxylate transporter substrate binding protein [Gemmatimonadaceae bacterium]
MNPVPVFKRFAFAALLALGCVVLPAIAQTAAPWPGRPVRIVVPYPPGGTTDLIARLLAEQFKNEFGQPFIVDNKPGAGTVMGAQFVANAVPDGTTLMLVTVSTMAINPVLLKKMPYRPEKLVPVALIAKAPFMLVASPAFPPNNIKEMLAYLKAHPADVNLAGQGTGASSHLVGEMFKAAAGVPSLTIVQYKGSAPANADAMAGHVQMHFDGINTSLPLVQQKRLKALAVTSETRVSAAPDVPTFVESGYPSVVASSWYGLVTPAGTPASVIDQLNAATNRALNTQVFKDRLAAEAATAGGGPPADFAKFVDSEIATWRKVLAPLKIDLD